MSEQPLPPHAQLIQMGNAFWVSRMIYVAALLGLADRLAGGPKTAEELAGPTKSHPRSLFRLMRALAGVGVFTQSADGRFGLTELGQALRSEAPGCARSSILALAGPLAWSVWAEFPHSVATGETGMEKVHGMGIFDYFAKDPELASHFSAAMVGFHGGEPPAVAAAYDFSSFGTVVDVGGATGNMLCAVLEKHPRVKGVLYDLPHVVADAPALIKQRGLSERITIESGSFFERVPSGGDAYILSHIIHDWSEDKCLTILGHVKRAMKPDGKVLLVEMVLSEGSEFHPGKMLDIVMLTLPGGEERTPKEYAALLAKAGLRLTRVVPPTLRSASSRRSWPKGRSCGPRVRDHPELAARKLVVDMCDRYILPLGSRRGKDALAVRQDPRRSHPKVTLLARGRLREADVRRDRVPRERKHVLRRPPPGADGPPRPEVDRGGARPGAHP